MLFLYCRDRPSLANLNALKSIFGMLQAFNLKAASDRHPFSDTAKVTRWKTGQSLLIHTLTNSRDRCAVTNRNHSLPLLCKAQGPGPDRKHPASPRTKHLTAVYGVHRLLSHPKPTTVPKLPLKCQIGPDASALHAIGRPRRPPFSAPVRFRSQVSMGPVRRVTPGLFPEGT